MAHANTAVCWISISRASCCCQGDCCAGRHLLACGDEVHEAKGPLFAPKPISHTPAVFQDTLNSCTAKNWT